MRAAVLLLAFLLLHSGPAHASLAPADLDAVGLSPASGAALPADVVLTDQRGSVGRLGDILGHRPAVLVLADYDCREICGPILSVVGAALAGTGLVAGQDYDLVAIGLNPRATPADAARMGAAQLGPVAEAAHLLGGTPEAVAVVEHALGYRAAYDAESGRYAHPADILVLTADARVSRVLPGLALDAGTLRLALVEAGQGRIGTLSDRLHLLCYGLDPAHGVANRAVGAALTAGGVLTLVGLGLFVVTLARRGPVGTRRLFAISGLPHAEQAAQQPCRSTHGFASFDTPPSAAAQDEGRQRVEKGVRFSQPTPSFRGGEAESGTGAPRPSSPKLPGAGSSLRSVRSDAASEIVGPPATPRNRT